MQAKRKILTNDEFLKMTDKQFIEMSHEIESDVDKVFQKENTNSVIDLRKPPEHDQYRFVIESIKNEGHFTKTCNELAKNGWIPMGHPFIGPQEDKYSYPKIYQQWVLKVNKEVKPLQVEVVNTVMYKKEYEDYGDEC